MAQLALGIAGAALLGPAGLGFAGLFGVSGAGIGFALGSALGASLSAPNQRVEGPRVTDLNLQVSSYGIARPVIEGTERVGGNVIWKTAIREVVNSSTQRAGKGGPKVTSITRTYNVDLAIALCEGEIDAIRKIWADGKLIVDFSSNQSPAQIIASELGAESYAFYPGSTTQLPDPTIEADKGVGNVPAYRGTCYIVLKEFDTTPYGGNRIPQLTFEVVKTANESGQQQIIAIDPETLLGQRLFPAFNETAIYWIRKDISTSTYFVYKIEPSTAEDGVFTLLNTLKLPLPADFSSSGISGGLSCDGLGDPVLYFGFFRLSSTLFRHTFTNLLTGQIVASIDFDASGETYQLGTAAYDKESGLVGGCKSAGAKKGYVLSPVFGFAEIEIPDIAVTPVYMSIYDGRIHVSGDDNKVYTWTFDSSGITYQYASPAYTANFVHANADGVWFAPSTGIGNLYRSTDNGQTFSVYSTILFGSSSSSGTRTFHANKNFVLWGPNISGGSSVFNFSIKNFFNVVPETELLSDIVSRRCIAGGLSAPQIDVTDLTDEVWGYAIARQMSARQAIEPLAKAYAFDAVESDGQIKFVKRGINAPVATIDYEELGASDFGNEPSEPLPYARQQEDELARSLSVAYRNILNDYQPGAEQAQRINTTSLTSIAEEIPIALQPDDAASIASRLLWEMWNERNTYSFTTTRKYAYLDPADVVFVQKASGEYVRLRLVTANDTGLLCEFTAVIDDPNIYGLTVQGAAPANGQGADSIVPPPNSQLAIVDSPLLRDTDDYIGPYVVMSSALSAGWTGATLYTGTSEATLIDRGSVSRRGIMGYAATVLGNYTGPVFFDVQNTVRVSSTGLLYSYNRDDVLNRVAPPYYLGGEVFYATTATYVSDGVYDLSGLLRGQLGTEQYISTHEVGDQFAVLENNGILKLSDQFSDIDAERIYKAVTFRQAISRAGSTSYAQTGASVKPLSGVNPRKSVDASNNITITWDRRTRYSFTFLQVEPPVGENSQAYEVDIYDGSGFANVLRTIATTTTSASYTAAQQVLDFGSNQSIIYVRIYQMSALVGRGFALQGTL